LYDKEARCRIICEANASAHDRQLCLEECKVNVLSGGDLKEMLAQFPEDNKHLRANHRLLELFSRHACDPTQVRREDLEFVPLVYSREVAVVAIPNDSWQATLRLLDTSVEQREALVREWRETEKYFSSDSLEQRDRKVKMFS
jgi:hypothetical protein